MRRSQKLRQERDDLRVRAEAIVAEAEKAGRDLTVEERKRADELLDKFDAMAADIARAEKLEQAEANAVKAAADADPRKELGRANHIEADANARISVRHPTEGDPTGGFANIGEYCMAVIHAGRNAPRGLPVDRRLQPLMVADEEPTQWVYRDNEVRPRAATSTFGSTGVAADGGAAVPPDFASAIMNKMIDEDPLMALFDQISIAGNLFSAPVDDDDAPWNNTQGIQVKWQGEGAAQTPTKPKTDELRVPVHKLQALIALTDELRQDAPGIESYVTGKAMTKLQFALNLAFLQGSGVGRPLGILNGAGIKSVAKVGSQVADTFVGQNALTMYRAMLAQHRRDAVWVANQDLEDQIWTLMKVGRLDTGAADTGWGVHLTTPPGAVPNAPDGAILTKRVIYSQACETVGDKGDVFFVSPKQYIVVRKAVGVQTQSSMHFWFDQGIEAFRITLRVGGAPWWKSTIAARDGAATYSPYVVLDERA